MKSHERKSHERKSDNSFASGVSVRLKTYGAGVILQGEIL